MNPSFMGAKSLFHMNIRFSETANFHISIGILGSGSQGDRIMIRFSKNFLTNPAQIWIYGIQCNPDNIIKIADSFKNKWMIVTIDSVTEESSLLKFVKDQGINYAVKQHPDNNIELSIAILYDMLEAVLKKADCENSEYIFIFDLPNLTNWSEYLPYSFEELVSTGVANMFLSVDLDENAMLLTLDKHVLSPQELYRRIKRLQFC